MPPAVVFDTNVLLSAIGWTGVPRECLNLARQGACQAFTCEQLMEELATVLQRKLLFSEQQVLETYQALMAFLRFVPISGTMSGLCVDPKDDKVLECALTAKASHIVSGDRKHLLPMRQFRGIAIVTPAEWRRMLKESRPS